MGVLSAAVLLVCLAASFAFVKRSVLLAFNSPCALGMFTRDGWASLIERAKEAVQSNSIYARLRKKAADKKREEQFRKGMPEVLRLLCIALESGSSINVALRYASDNCDEPLAGELKRCVWDLEAGQGFGEAMKKLRERTGGSEFAFLAVAMEISHRSGASLTSVLENISALLRQTTELKEDLRTKTAQGRLSSRIVLVMPFVLLAMISIFSPGYITGFLGSPLGICLFAAAVMFEILGAVLVKRAMSIDFSIDLEEAV